MKPFPLIHKIPNILSTDKKVTGFLKKNFTIFLGKTKTNGQPRYVYVKIFFIFIFIYIMLILKELCINKGSHSKNLVNQPTLIIIRVGGLMEMVS